MKKIFNKEIYPIIGILSYFLLYFYFLLNTGFSSDDAYNAHFRGHLVDERTTLWDYYSFHFLRQIEGSGGRLSFVAILYNTGLYYITQSTYIIKTISLLVLSLTVLYFYLFIKNLTKSRDFALLVALLIPVFFQIRPWHDPIIAFTFLFPLVFLLIFSSLVSFQYALKINNIYYKFVSCILYFLACFMYEIAYFLFPLFLLAALNQKEETFSKNNLYISIKKSFPQMFIGIFSILWVLFYKYFGGEDNWRTNIAFSEDFFYAFYYQLTASFPLSFWFFNADWSSLKFKYFDFFIILITPFLLYFFSKKIFSTKKSKLPIISILFITFILWVFPAVITALSGHQIELKNAGMGFGYLPVFFQYFGTCLLLSLVIYKIFYKYIGNKNLVISIFVLIFSPLFVINYAYNQDVALSGDVVFKHPRNLLISALEAGLLEKVNEEDIIFRPGYYPSDYYTGYYSVLGIRVNMCDTRFLPTFEKYSSDFDKCFEDGFGNGDTFKYKKLDDVTILEPNHKAWFVSYEYEKRGNGGYVYFAQIDEMIVEEADVMKILAAPVSDVYVYSLETNSIEKLNIPKGKKFDMNKFSEDRSLVYSIRKNGRTPVDIDKYIYDPISFSWSDQVYPREGDSENNLRWTSGFAELKIFNLSSEEKKVNYSFSISSPTGRNSVITINDQDYNLAAGAHLPVSNEVVVGRKPFKLEIYSDDLPIDNGDPRNIVFGIFNYKQWVDTKKNETKATLEKNSIYPSYGPGWHSDEKTHRWSNKRNPIIYLNSPFALDKNLLLSFKLGTVLNNSVRIIFNGKEVGPLRYITPKNSLSIGPINLEVKTGINVLEFRATENPSKPKNGDHRVLGISISDLNLEVNEN